MNTDKKTKEEIFKILESPFIQSNGKFSLNQLDKIKKIFSYGRAEYLLKSTGIINKFKLDDQRDLNDVIRARELNTLNIFNEFLIIAKKLEQKKIYFIPLKGIQLNVLIYKNLNLRPMRDIDLLVKVESLNDYLECMFSNGYKFKNSNINFNEFALGNYHYDIPVLVNDNGIHVETHLRVINEKFNNFIFDTAFEKQFSQSLNLKFMSFENMIIHLIFHGTIKNGFDNGLISIFDVKEILNKEKINFQYLKQIASEMGLSKNLYYFFNLINKRFENNFLYNEFEFRKINSEKLNDYEDLMLLNNADAFSFKLFNQPKLFQAFSYNAYLSETGSKKINLLNYLARFKRISLNFLKTVSLLLTDKRFRADVKRTKSLNEFLLDNKC